MLNSSYLSVLFRSLTLGALPFVVGCGSNTVPIGSANNSVVCATSECGATPATAALACADGSSVVTTGRCVKAPSGGACSWEVTSCPVAGGADATADGNATVDGNTAACHADVDCPAPQVGVACADGTFAGSTGKCTNGTCTVVTQVCTPTVDGAAADVIQVADAHDVADSGNTADVVQVPDVVTTGMLAQCVYPDGAVRGVCPSGLTCAWNGSCDPGPNGSPPNCGNVCLDCNYPPTIQAQNSCAQQDAGMTPDLTGLHTSCTSGMCPGTLTPVSYYGIAGMSGPKFCSCEIPCAKVMGVCPLTTHCVNIADGPGLICSK